MTTQMTSEEFFALVERSGLLSAARSDPYLDRARSGDAAMATPEGMARQLVRDRLLTPFQARQLLRGRYRGFFLTDKYKVLELLGEGGMGRVLLCEHLILHKLVAVKLLQISGGSMAGAAERFLREARAAAALDHPNIVRVFDVDKAGQVPFMVMDYVDGTNLHQLVAENGPLAVNRAAEYIRQAALGLQAAHEHGLIHRDIKPGNLLLDRNGTVKLLDLGLARFFDTEKNNNLTQKFDEKSVLGTADFIAPEQAMNSSKVDIRADIYSLGCTLYFLLLRRFPYDEGSVTQKLLWHQTREAEPVETLRSDVPPALAAAVARMMKKKPEDRFATPAEVAAALAPVCGGVAPPPPEEMPKVRPTMYQIGLCGQPSAHLLGASEAVTPAPAQGDTSRSLPRRSTADVSLASGTGPAPALPATGTPRSMPPATSPGGSGSGFQPPYQPYPPAHTGPLPQPGTGGYPPHTGAYPPGYPSTAYPPPPEHRPARSPVLYGLLALVGTIAAGLGGMVATGNLGRPPAVASTQPAPSTKTDAAPTKPDEGVPPSGVILNGAGSSFVNPLMQEWAKLYLRETGDKISYDSLGSGRGISGVTEKLIDFGCSDAPMNDTELAAARTVGGTIVHIPLAMGAVVPTYNVPGLTEQLKFTGPLLAQIFMGKITKWNDPSIKALNPSADFPDDLGITVVHRKDKSGTTFIWTDYLSKVSQPFKEAIGAKTAVTWPAGQLEGEGNNGVAEQVNRVRGAIGYNELSYALTNGLAYAVVKNKAGRYPAASFESVTAAAAAKLQDADWPADLRYSLTDVDGADSYPICGTVWAMVYQNPPKGNAKDLARFFWWATHDGQKVCKPMMYAPLPDALVKKCEEKIRSIIGAGGVGS